MIKGGPRVVTDGLVLCLDAHDAKSYAGEPVTNLASGSWFTWVNSGAWTQNTYTTHESCPVGFPPGLKGVSGVQVLEGICTTTGSIHFGTGNVNPASASTQYTYSVWFYQKDRAGIGAPYARANVSNTNLGTMKYNGTTGSSNWPVNKWIKLEITFTTQSSDTQTYISNYIGSQVGDTMYFCAPQSEQKSYYSPYANSSRSATNGWVDRSGNGNHGTLVNMVGTGASHYRDGQIIMPVANSYLDFDGSNDVVRCSTSLLSTSDQPFTLSFWMYNRANNGGHFISKINDSTTWDGFAVWNNSGNGKIRFGLFKTYGTVQMFLDSSTTINLNTWYHVTCIYTGTQGQVYINGALDNSQNYSGGYDGINYFYFGIGGRGAGGGNANAKIANVLAYDRAITAAEVLSNYNATKGRFS